MQPQQHQQLVRVMNGGQPAHNPNRCSAYSVNTRNSRYSQHDSSVNGYDISDVPLQPRPRLAHRSDLSRDSCYSATSRDSKDVKHGHHHHQQHHHQQQQQHHYHRNASNPLDVSAADHTVGMEAARLWWQTLRDYNLRGGGLPTLEQVLTRRTRAPLALRHLATFLRELPAAPLQVFQQQSQVDSHGNPILDVSYPYVTADDPQNRPEGALKSTTRTHHSILGVPVTFFGVESDKNGVAKGLAAATSRNPSVEPHRWLELWMAVSTHERMCRVLQSSFESVKTRSRSHGGGSANYSHHHHTSQPSGMPAAVEEMRWLAREAGLAHLAYAPTHQRPNSMVVASTGPCSRRWSGYPAADGTRSSHSTENGSASNGCSGGVAFSCTDSQGSNGSNGSNSSSGGGSNGVSVASDGSIVVVALPQRATVPVASASVAAVASLTSANRVSFPPTNISIVSAEGGGNRRSVRFANVPPHIETQPPYQRSSLYQQQYNHNQQPSPDSEFLQGVPLESPPHSPPAPAHPELVTSASSLLTREERAQSTSIANVLDASHSAKTDKRASASQQQQHQQPVSTGCVFPPQRSHQPNRPRPFSAISAASCISCTGSCAAGHHGAPITAEQVQLATHTILRRFIRQHNPQLYSHDGVSAALHSQATVAVPTPSAHPSSFISPTPTSRTVVSATSANSSSSPSSSNPLPLPADIVLDVVKRYEARGALDPELFSAVRQYAFALLDAEYFWRFLDSAVYENIGPGHARIALLSGCTALTAGFATALSMAMLGVRPSAARLWCLPLLLLGWHLLAVGLLRFAPYLALRNSYEVRAFVTDSIQERTIIRMHSKRAVLITAISGGLAFVCAALLTALPSKRLMH